MSRLNTYKSSAKAGKEAEIKFKNLMVSRGHEVQKGTQHDDTVRFIDCFVTPKQGKTRPVQVKNRNTSGRGCPFDDKFVTLELNNVGGAKGWLYGEADYLAKEVEGGFDIYSMKALREFVEKKVSPNVTIKTRLIDSYKPPMKYGVYLRSGGKEHKNADKLVYAAVEDIKEFCEENRQAKSPRSYDIQQIRE
mgnify:CR=1 FL=1|tara:strand:+ start:1832 stop:2407 length:576 start_codon:yes stop_codon:yes gene_type:complete